MVAKRSVQLDELAEPINVGQAFKAAERSLPKRNSKGKAGARSKPDKACTLTRKHHCIKHLYACEQSHCWQWVPDRRLSNLWNQLDAEQKDRIVQTHDGLQPSQRFCAELNRHVELVKCHASEASKMKMASLIWRDSSNSEIFKNMFRAAVEENMAMIIDMEVMAAVDSVLQDYCAESADHASLRHWRNKVMIRGLMLTVFLFWLYGSAWTWLVTLIAVVIVLVYVWVTAPPCDPRTFELGSERWAQYREHEHVRLMFISAMLCVFEVRLLLVWENRRKQARPKRGPADPPRQTPRRHGEFTDGPLREESVPTAKYLGPRRLSRQRKRMGTSTEEHHCEEGEEEESAVQDVATHRESHTADTDSMQRIGEDQVGDDSVAEDWGCLEDDFDTDVLGEQGDEIDAEFAQRVREHFQSRAQAASQSSLSQTTRGNQVLKSLCEKLKHQLENRIQ